MLRRVAFVAAMIAPTPVAGEPTREVVELRYDAPATCPQRAAFASAVTGRAAGAILVAEPAGDRRVFAISITDHTTGFLGTLEVTGSSTRSLSAPSCDEVVSALALIAALAIDPEAAVAAPIPMAPPVADMPPPPPTVHERYTWQIVAAGGLAVDVTPGAMPVVGFEGRLARRDLGHVGAAAIAGRDTEPTAVGTARFTWIVGRLSACWTWRERPLQADLCGHLVGGGLAARGEDIVGAQGATRAWFAVGGDAGARWPPSSSTFVELRLGLTAPLIRDLFYFNPDVMVHRAGAVTPWITAGGGVRFR